MKKKMNDKIVMGIVLLMSLLWYRFEYRLDEHNLVNKMPISNHILP